MTGSYNEKRSIGKIDENLTLGREEAKKCAGPMRSALESAVKLFWLKKYGGVPVRIENDRETFDLREAISDKRFSECFDGITVSYMHLIGRRCNEVLRGGSSLTLNETSELFSMSDKCIRAIERAIPLTVPSGMQQANIKRLKRNDAKTYGGSARPIYRECCRQYGWDENESFKFGPRQLLYAKGATPEKYSPWFLCHSNWTDDRAKKWENVISKDQNTIWEFWSNHFTAKTSDLTARVVFAKRDNEYYFLGIYAPDAELRETVRDGKTVWCKTYKCRSECYPEV